MGMLFLQKGILLTLLLDCSFCLFKLLFGWYVNQKNMYMQINIWKKWKVFLHSSSSLFFSNPKELTTFFLLLTEKHRISTKTWRNYCFAFTMKQSFLFYGDVMLRDTLSKLLWITCYTQKIIKSCLALHKV